MQKSDSIQYKIKAHFRVNMQDVLIRSAATREIATAVAKLFESSSELKDVTISWDGAERVVTQCGDIPADIFEKYMTDF